MVVTQSELREIDEIEREILRLQEKRVEMVEQIEERIKAGAEIESGQFIWRGNGIAEAEPRQSSESAGV